LTEPSGVYEAYVRTVRERLSDADYDITEGTQIGNYSLGLIAHKRERIQTRLVDIYVAHLESVDLSELREYSASMSQHAKVARVVPGNNLVCIPVLVSSIFADEVKEEVSSHNEIGTFTKWLMGWCEHPVLAELASRRIYHYEKYPFLTNLLVKHASKLSLEHLQF